MPFEKLPSYLKDVRILLAVAVLALIGVGGYTQVRQMQNENSPELSNTQPGEEREGEAPFAAVGPHTIVYGTWSNGAAQVKAYSLETGEKHLLATLPINVKHVKVLSPETLVYVSDTDDRDHGGSLSTYSVSSGESQVVYTATDGFRIDDYVVSPDGQRAAVWEVKLQPGSAVLRGGSSRVVSAQLNAPEQKHVLVDEVQSDATPVHYPRAITNNGEVFMDKFLPNTIGGWAYGMSVANFTGSQKEELTAMANGTYGTQPMLSPRGDMLVFAGYDGAFGDGTAVSGEVRKAVLRPNTIEILNTTTKQREKLENLSPRNTYSYVSWDKGTGDVTFYQLAPNAQQSGYYRYDLATKQATKIDMGQAETADGAALTLISLLSNDKVLVGQQSASDSTLGNLGERYGHAYEAFATADAANAPINTFDGYMQYITLVPSTYYGNADKVLGTSDPHINMIQSDCAKDSLQLCTFSLKVSLEPKRENQQTKPRCEKDLAEPQCREQGYADGTREFKDCVNQLERQYKSEGVCYDSPLYLYGEEGKKVRVQINTPITSDVPTRDNGYDVTLLSGNNLSIGGKTYPSIDYDYTAGVKRITPPTNGTIVAVDDVDKTLRSYAAKLGLNERETVDLVEYGREKVDSPYVFISFFDQATSKRILPIAFTPAPDNYINYVFYFKKLSEKPSFSVNPPVFPAIPSRDGFTAVEISGIVE